MAKKVQVTLTANEGKRLIAKAAGRMPEIQNRLKNHKILLCGGTTVSALSEELGFGPLRISGRIDASGTRTALKKAKAPHNLLLDHGNGQNVDSSIQKVAESLNDKDLVVVGANAIDPMGRAALAFAALGGGSRGYALHSAYMQGVPMLILAGINKLIPDLGAAQAHSGRAGIDLSMGAAIGLYNLFGPVITELKAFEILFGVEAVVIAGSGFGTGDGTRTFVLRGEEASIQQAWELCLGLKGAGVSACEDSLFTCVGGCRHCQRHVGCYYKELAQGED